MAKKQKTTKKTPGRKRPNKKTTKDKKTARKKVPTAKEKARKSVAPKKRTRRQQKDVRKNIAKAVESLPSLIVEEAGLETSAPTIRQQAPKKPKLTPPAHYKPPKRGRWLMWFGIITLSAVVFIMWIWNAQTLIRDLGETNGAEKGILGSASDDLSEAISAITSQNDDILNNLADDAEQEEQKENAKEDIKEALSGLLGEITTTPATSTESATTTED